jgi:hypothetical protein
LNFAVASRTTTQSKKDKRCNVTSEEAKAQMQFIEKILTEAFRGLWLQ